LKKIFILICLFLFLVSCDHKVTVQKSSKNKKNVVEFYKMTAAEKNTLKMIGENIDNLALFKVKIDKGQKFKEINARIKIYEDGKLIQTISNFGMSLEQKNDKPFYISFRRQLQLETDRTYDWKTTISLGGSSRSMFNQPQMTNISTFEPVRGKLEIEKNKEIVLGAIVDAVDSMETVGVNPDLNDNKRLFKNKYVYLFCIEAK
jgi:hypothetical protein